jgi:hypothetical protein
MPKTIKIGREKLESLTILACEASNPASFRTKPESRTDKINITSLKLLELFTSISILLFHSRI